jgi:hypothetical protein
MPGLDPGIHAFLLFSAAAAIACRHVGGRVKPGHDVS